MLRILFQRKPFGQLCLALLASALSAPSIAAIPAVPTAPAPGSVYVVQSENGCSSDQDCKGDRICNTENQCVSPYGIGQGPRKRERVQHCYFTFFGNYVCTWRTVPAPPEACWQRGLPLGGLRCN